MEATPQFYSNKEEVKRAQEVANQYHAKGYEKEKAMLRVSDKTTILVPKSKLHDEEFIARKREKYRTIAKNLPKTRIV